MIQKHVLAACFSLCALGLAQPQAAEAAKTKAEGVKITPLEDRLRIEVGGELFTEYVFANTSRPYFYPIIGPDGARMTRNWPMREVPNEEQDHPHHRSLWFGHGDVNGHDFWAEGRNSGKTVHQNFLEVKSGKESGGFRSSNALLAADGAPIGTEEFSVRISDHPSGKIMDFDVTIIASNGDLVLGDTKEGTMAIRVAETMRLKGKVGRGHIVNSEGVTDGKAWGKRAAWCDYYGPVDGKTVGVAIFDHPKNPRHPTWWHVRDYGLFAANPFGVHDFEKKPAGTGNMKIPAGEKVTFRYRFYFHRGNTKEADVAGEYKRYGGAESAADKPQAK